VQIVCAKMSGRDMDLTGGVQKFLDGWFQFLWRENLDGSFFEFSATLEHVCSSSWVFVLKGIHLEIRVMGEKKS